MTVKDKNETKEKLFIFIFVIKIIFDVFIGNK